MHCKRVADFSDTICLYALSAHCNSKTNVFFVFAFKFGPYVFFFVEILNYSTFVV